MQWLYWKILAKFLQETVFYHKNRARNSFVCSEDKLICWEQLTMILGFRFTKIVQNFGNWNFCTVSIVLIQYRAGLLISVIIYYERKIIPSVCRFFSPWLANLEWTCSQTWTIKKIGVKNPEKFLWTRRMQFWQPCRKFLTQSPKTFRSKSKKK